MFAILVIERKNLDWSGLLEAMQTWVQDVGLLAALALLIWCVAYVIRRPPGGSPGWSPQAYLFVTCLVGSALGYAGFAALLLLEGTVPTPVQGDYGKTAIIQTLTTRENWLFTIGGGFAFLAVLIPVLSNLPRLRARRIWALARLSMKETVRHRVLWVFSLLLLVVLFASWFIGAEKPEFQLKNYIWVVDWTTTILLLLAASLLAAFSIPTDVKSQTIHTVVTKPVERFEIVLGRFVGYTLLMTGVLLTVTALGLLYVARMLNMFSMLMVVAGILGIGAALLFLFLCRRFTPGALALAGGLGIGVAVGFGLVVENASAFPSLTSEAAAENYKARVPIYGYLSFLGTKGESVGKEGAHRKYIWGPKRGKDPHQFAVWVFHELPAGLAGREEGVRCELSFDIFRTRKSDQEGKGIFCTLVFATRNGPTRPLGQDFPKLDARKMEQIDGLRRTLQSEGLTPEEIERRIARKYGFFENSSMEIKNFHTYSINVPVELFQNLRDPAEGDGVKPDLLLLFNVNQKSTDQLVGMAPEDLYLLDREKTFEENYFKAAFGLWCRLTLLVGLAVSCGTYLSGIIAWLCTMFLFGLGLFKEDIRQLALGLSEGGGPLEALIKVATGKPVAYRPEETATVQVAQAFDEGFRSMMGQVLKLVPDVNRYDLSRYTANGFDIAVWQGDHFRPALVPDNLVPLLAYLIPCLVFAFYLIKYREVANPS